MITKPLFRNMLLGCLSFLILSGCGGGGSSLDVDIAAVQPTAENEIPITVDSGPDGTAHNVPYVSVTICEPGSNSNCQTVDHIQVDTGSTGLRLIAGALNSTVASALTQVSLSGVELDECMQFADGYTWGPIKQADVQIGSFTISKMAVQIVSAQGQPSVPSDCSSKGASENSVAAFGANGIIGIGAGAQDCGTTCESSSTAGVYYTCTDSSTCSSTAVPVAQQVQQPVSLISSTNYNNGTLIQLPVLSSHVGTNTTGSLIFGIGTVTNNTPGAGVTQLALDSSTLTLTAQLSTESISYPFAVIDSGTTDWTFDDNGSMPLCSSSSIAPGYYCPATTQSFTVVLQGADGAATGTVNFNIDNAVTALSSSNTAYDSVGAPLDSRKQYFIAGLPFFYGRSVWTAIEGMSTSLGTGPYVAYQ